jgi:hypothetical protein
MLDRPRQTLVEDNVSVENQKWQIQYTSNVQSEGVFPPGCAFLDHKGK